MDSEWVQFLSFCSEHKLSVDEAYKAVHAFLGKRAKSQPDGLALEQIGERFFGKEKSPQIDFPFMADV